MKKRLNILIFCFALAIVFLAFCYKLGNVFDNGKVKAEENASSSSAINAVAATAEQAEKHGKYETAEERIATMTMVAKEGSKELYFDYSYGEIAVVDTDTKNTWFSTPFNYQNDLMASDDVKAQLASMVRIKYYDTSMKERSMNSFSDCTAKEVPQFTTEAIENGIRINMQIGIIETMMLLPDAAEVSRFEEKVISRLNEKDARKIKTYYSKISLSDTTLGDAAKKNYKEYYPGLSAHDFYILRNVSDREKRMIEKIIRTTDYTMQDYDDDRILCGYVSEDGVTALFNISVECSLSGGDLIVSIPADRIEYDKKEFVLSEITLCEFFGAGHSRSDGYLFVPDGSGTLIKYNTQREKSILYTTNTVYGDDYSLTNQWAYNSLKQQIYFPVFGNKEDDKAIFAIIEEGDAMAKIISESGNILSSYETVFPVFNYATTYTVNYQDETKMRGMYTYHDKNYYDGNYTVRYHFLSGEDASYIGMANSYREFLVSRGILTKLEESTSDTPLYIETLGSILKKDTIFGFPYNKAIGLTTFEEAKTIITDLKEEGIHNLNIRYKGWMNGGLDYSVPNKVKVEKSLGGSKGLSKLIEYTKENNVGLLPDVDFCIARNNGLFDGYNEAWDSPRTLSRQTAYMISPQEITNLAYLQYLFYSVSPNLYDKYFKNFFKEYNHFNIDGVSVGNFGTMLYSDYKKSAAITRQQALDIIVKNMNNYCENLNQFMTDGGNAYMLKYSTDIVNIPLTDSGNTLSDESVPFMQLVLHGYLPYSGSAINLSSNIEDTVLKSIEYGSNMFFTTTYKNSEELKETPYSYYYTLDYTTWRQSIINIYNKYNKVYKDLQNQAMTDHRKLKENVYQTTYENGTKIIVNYNQDFVTVNDTIVEAKSFVVTR